MDTPLDTITISGEGRSVTLSGDQWDAATTQLPLFSIDKTAGIEFLTQACIIEDEMDRLRKDLQDLVTQYTERLPLRALRVALKVVRARKKLEEHPKEPMSYEHQAQLEGFVAAHIAAFDAAKRQTAKDAEQSTRAAPDMAGTQDTRTA